MLRHFQSARFALFGLFFAFSVAGAQADDLTRLATEAVTLSGTRAALDGLAVALDAQTRANPDFAKLDEAERKTVDTILKRAFDGSRMAEALTAGLAATGDRARLAAAVETMRPAAFQETTRHLVAETLAVTEPQLVAYANSFEQTPPPPARVTLMQRYDAATDGARILAEFRTDAARRVLANAPIDAATRQAELARLDAMQDEIATNAYQESLLRSLYSFRKLDDTTVAAYVAAYETEAMGWLSRHVGYAMQRTSVDAVEQVMNALVELRRADTAAPADAAR